MVVDPLASAPGSPTEGQVYYDTDDNLLYVYDGSSWVAAGKGHIISSNFSPVADRLLLEFDGADFDVTDNSVGNATVIELDPLVAKFAVGSTFDPIGIQGGDALDASLQLDSTGKFLEFGFSTSIGKIQDDGSGILEIFGEDGLIITANAGDLVFSATGDIDFGLSQLSNVADPISASDAATKSYVDTVAQGLDAKEAVYVAYTSNITLSGSATSSGGITPANGDRVLAAGQTSPQNNGIYIVNTSGAWTRAPDTDTWDELVHAYVFVIGGTYANTGWVSTTTPGAPSNLGTVAINWVQFSGAGQITAGTGLTKTGDTLNIGAGTGITVNADDVAIDTSVVPRKAVANTFTAAQTIDLGATGTALTLDIHTGGGEKWLFFSEGSTERGYVAENSNNLVVHGSTGNLILSALGDVAFTGSGIDAGNVRIKSVADATTATDAMNRQSSDSRYKRKSLHNVGDGTSTNIALTHNLGTRDVDVDVYRNSSPYDQIIVDNERTDTNTVTLKFAVAPGSNAFRAIISA